MGAGSGWGGGSRSTGIRDGRGVILTTLSCAVSRPEDNVCLSFPKVVPPPLSVPASEAAEPVPVADNVEPGSVFTIFFMKDMTFVGNMLIVSYLCEFLLDLKLFTVHSCYMSCTSYFGLGRSMI